MSKQIRIQILCAEAPATASTIGEITNYLNYGLKRVFSPDIQFQFVKTDLLIPQDFVSDHLTSSILILDKENAGNEIFMQNLNKIADTLVLDKMEFAGSQLLFKIVLQPNDLIPQPEPIKTLLSYDFFEFTGLRENFKTLNSQHAEILLWSKILDLVYDIKDIHQQAHEHKEKFVFLGNCSTDKQQCRDDIKRELQHYAYRILPVFEYTNQGDELKELIHNYLDHSSVIVQLFGANYGKVEKGDKFSMLEFENTVIHNYLEKNPHKTRLMWIPEDLKISDTRQDLFITRLKQNQSSINSSIIETGLEEFKCILAYHINSQKIKIEETTQKYRLYLLQKKQSQIPIPSSILEMYQIQVLVDNEVVGKKMSYTRHLKDLASVEGVLINYPESDNLWLQSKLGDIVKAIGVGRNSSFKAIGILTNEMVDIEEMARWLPALEIIPSDNPDKLTQFLNKLNA